LTAAFLKGDECVNRCFSSVEILIPFGRDRAHFVDLLASVLTTTRYTPHEFAESVLPSVHAETSEASNNPAVTALDLAHTLAFRSGLGASLFASPHAHFGPEDARSFAHTAFSKQNVAVVGTGIDGDLLSRLVSHSLVSLASSSSAAPAPTKYFGGENRVAAGGHGQQPQTIFVGYGTTTPKLHELATLKEYLAPHPHLKWTHGSTGGLFEGLPAHARVEPVLLPYTDAALFGVLIQAPTTNEVRQAGKVVANVLKGAAGSVKAEDLKKAVCKAKFDAASALERREGVVGAAIAQARPRFCRSVTTR
jgi:ubiquinol-cytochrome c reductase core subunit 2